MAAGVASRSGRERDTSVGLRLITLININTNYGRGDVRRWQRQTHGETRGHTHIGQEGGRKEGREGGGRGGRRDGGWGRREGMGEYKEGNRIESEKAVRQAVHIFIGGVYLGMWSIFQVYSRLDIERT